MQIITGHSHNMTKEQEIKGRSWTIKIGKQKLKNRNGKIEIRIDNRIIELNNQNRKLIIKFDNRIIEANNQNRNQIFE